MQTIKELELMDANEHNLAYSRALKDVLGLIDEFKEKIPETTRFELKKRIIG